MAAVNIVILLLLIVANGLLSLSELAVVSARRSRLQAKADRGDPGAIAALQLGQRPDRFLSTVQIGITLIGILSGAFGGATLAGPVGDWLDAIPGVDRYSDQIAAVLVVLVITYLSLVIGELVPKRLALQNPEGIAAAVARPMQTLSRIAAPAVSLLSVSSDAVMEILGNRQSDEPPVTEEEINLLLRQGAQAGIFDETEEELVSGVFRLGDRLVEEVMTPRHRVVFLDLEDPEAERRRVMAESPHSHFPVCAGDLDNVQGVVSVKALWSRALLGESTELTEVMTREIIFVPETVPALVALERFKQSPVTIALVVDEYGGIAGLLSMHDLLEAIVSDVGEVDGAPNDEAVRRPDGSWLLDGAMLIDEVPEQIGLPDIPDDDGLYHTLAGFILDQLGRIPRPGDRLAWRGWTFEVVDMDGNRIDKILVSRANTDLGIEIPG